MLGLQLYQPYVEYMDYITTFGKSYVTMEEFETRRGLYAQTDELIKAHNSSDSGYQLGHNKFSDWTDFERSKLRGLMRNQSVSGEDPVRFDAVNLHANFDWRLVKGVVTPVKN